MSDAWSVVWSVPVLRDLDDAARARLRAAGRLRRYTDGHGIYREHDPADAFYVVITGRVELRATRRGDETMSVLRRVAAAETFGEEALEKGRRHGHAVACGEVEVVQLPAALFLRGAGRSGGAPIAERELRRLRRNATRDLLRTMAATRGLDEADLDLVLDGVVASQVRRGATIFAAGDPPDGLWLVVDGLVQLQTHDDDRIHVRAYLTRGDGFGDEETMAASPRQCAAVAMGDTRLLRLPPAVLRTLVDRNPGILDSIRRVSADRQAVQQSAVGAAAAQTTQHVFRDLYRMQMARSLLVIDQDTCVRCGHCAWTCETLHGTSRLVRRGDKIIAQVGAPGQAQHSLLLPNSCQHCENPSCMIDCPTGAIGRDPRGEVFIRESLCTGCGNCAKACPWENIRMASRPEGSAVAGGLSLSADVATKCDLCRAYEAPGCVQACPTGSIVRLDPSRDVAEVAAVLGSGGDADNGTASGLRGRVPVHAIVRGTAVVVAMGLGAVALRSAELALWVPARGPGLWSGVAAAVGMVILVGHLVPKRLVGLWMKKRRRTSAARRLVGVQAPAKPTARSKVRPWLTLHISLGVLTMAGVLGHAGLRVPANPAGSLHLAFWTVSLLGVFGGLTYRLIPRRLARLERRGDLPEDLRNERRTLLDRLFVQVSGRDALVKTIASRVLVPYARSVVGPWRLLTSGRSLTQERARLRAQIDTMRQGRGLTRLEGLDDAIGIAVELRALPVRRVLTSVLRGWLPLHIVVSTVVLVLLGLHIAMMVGGP